ncbi:MAG: hypothetical protein KDD47_18940, partial [Acidobacteria bacterium]|nr:hypothetical protein [Acidobacteriota bacterium]
LDPGPQTFGGALLLRGARPLSTHRVFAELGVGAFDPEGLDWAPGVVLGIGTDFLLGPRWRAELGVRFLHLFTGGDDLELLAVSAGLRIPLAARP